MGEGIEEVEKASEQDVEVTTPISSEKDERDNDFLAAPLRPTRSRSSARSHTDGYSHFQCDDDEEKQQPTSTGHEDGKEFEVKFDGDSDPWNPKTCNTKFKKWCIVLIGSGCSLCVTCASALYG